MTACTEKMAAELQALLYRRLRGEIMEHLAADRRPQSSDTMAATMGRPHHAVQMAVCHLIARGHLVVVGEDGCGRPAYRPVEVGPCEWCGLISHRLVVGECPQCAAQVVGLPYKRCQRCGQVCKALEQGACSACDLIRQALDGRPSHDEFSTGESNDE